MKRVFSGITIVGLLMLFRLPAYGLTYSVAGPDNGPMGIQREEDSYGVPVTWEDRINRDRSKNAAYIPPAFGSPTADTLEEGRLLTPYLLKEEETEAKDSLPSGIKVWSVLSGNDAWTESPYIPQPKASESISFTPESSQLYYAGGHLGVLNIPAFDLEVKIYPGTDSKTLARGIGHFSGTSIWDGNVCLAAHNRGAADYFGEIHTLDQGDMVTLTTKLGTRTYKVSSVRKIHRRDLTVLKDSGKNLLTLITCVRDQPEYRWCVLAAES